MNGQMEARVSTGVQVKNLKGKIESLNAKLSEYEEREKSRTSLDANAKKPPTSE